MQHAMQHAQRRMLLHSTTGNLRAEDTVGDTIHTRGGEGMRGAPTADGGQVMHGKGVADANGQGNEGMRVSMTQAQQQAAVRSMVQDHHGHFFMAVSRATPGTPFPLSFLSLFRSLH